MSVVAFDHAAIPMQNTDAMLAFYRALGFAVTDATAPFHISNFEQPLKDVMVHDFTVMSAMAIRVKSDQTGQCGVVHATGA